MYREFYGLNKKPFQISADPEFLWLGPKHKEGLSVLLYGVHDNRGFLVLSGGVGTGKTTLVHALHAQLDENVVVATVPDPGLELIEFYQFIAASFGMPGKYHNKVKFLLDFEAFLKEIHAQGRIALLIIDEAQRLSSALLEEVRLLSNIETPKQKLLNIFFVGQEEVYEIISTPQNRALRQRITINYHLEALSQEETRLLIDYRLKVAGATKPIFDDAAIDGIYAFTKGHPRRINILCDHALLTGFVKNQKNIGAEIITECSSELRLPGELPGVGPSRAEDTKPREFDIPAMDSGAPLDAEPPAPHILSDTIPDDAPSPASLFWQDRKRLIFAAAALCLLVLAVMLYLKPQGQLASPPQNDTSITLSQAEPSQTETAAPDLNSDQSPPLEERTVQGGKSLGAPEAFADGYETTSPAASAQIAPQRPNDIVSVGPSETPVAPASNDNNQHIGGELVDDGVMDTTSPGTAAPDPAPATNDPSETLSADIRTSNGSSPTGIELPQADGGGMRASADDTDANESAPDDQNRQNDLIIAKAEPTNLMPQKPAVIDPASADSYAQSERADRQTDIEAAPEQPGRYDSTNAGGPDADNRQIASQAPSASVVVQPDSNDLPDAGRFDADAEQTASQKRSDSIPEQRDGHEFSDSEGVDADTESTFSQTPTAATAAAKPDDKNASGAVDHDADPDRLDHQRLEETFSDQPDEVDPPVAGNKDGSGRTDRRTNGESVSEPSSKPLVAKTAPNPTAPRKATPDEPPEAAASSRQSTATIAATATASRSGRAIQAPTTSEQLKSFLQTYSRLYSAKDLNQFKALFTDDATERGRSFAGLIPVYRANFKKLNEINYQIKMTSYTERANGREILVKGDYRLLYRLEGQDFKMSDGRIEMDLVKLEDGFRVKRLDYQQK